MWPATNTQYAVFSQISMSNLLRSVFAQPAQGCRFSYEITTTNLVHSHDWVHGIFLCLNGGSAPCQGNSDTVSRQSRCIMGSLKATFISGMMSLKEQLIGALKRSCRGSHKAVGDLCTAEMVCWLKIAISLMQAWSSPLKWCFCIFPYISHFGFSTRDGRQKS